MKHIIGKQYEKDDAFKAKARLHQSRYRAGVLNVDFDEYGNRLGDEAGRALLNYYPALGCREALRRRYPKYSKKRDGDMLRSEHIPFNMLAPLKTNEALAQRIIEKAFGIATKPPYDIRIEWAPSPKENYVDDATSFDTYIQCKGTGGQTVGIGIEVKYTEQGYPIGDGEKQKVLDANSTYWTVSRRSGVFINPKNDRVTTDDLRQIWRNHLLGLAMVQRNELDDFFSITLYPSGNHHFDHALAEYRNLLKPSHNHVRGCRFEDFIEAIDGDTEILKWQQWLANRYIVNVE
ncbi:MAG: hypothetical protein JXX29_18405 [Deltaproteobacteria bacterium]|nr:hypothetical protein [Deltaproteobacteria bacterium]MBN2673658.1 hypothetical protein [Deltaproteobacteria bacterium]